MRELRQAKHNKWRTLTRVSQAGCLVAVAAMVALFAQPTRAAQEVAWKDQAGSGTKNWSAMAGSADGTKLVAAVNVGNVYTSTDSGVTWEERPITGLTTPQKWTALASSADGSKIAAFYQWGGYMYTSNDSGVYLDEKWSSRSCW